MPDELVVQAKRRVVRRARDKARHAESRRNFAACRVPPPCTGPARVTVRANDAFRPGGLIAVLPEPQAIEAAVQPTGHSHQRRFRLSDSKMKSRTAVIAYLDGVKIRRVRRRR